MQYNHTIQALINNTELIDWDQIVIFISRGDGMLGAVIHFKH